MAITKKDGNTELWMDARGDWVPPRHVRTIDKKRDKLVEKLCKIAQRVHDDMVKLKKLCDQDIDAFLDHSLRQTGTQPGGVKSVTLANFSHTRKIERQEQDFIDFDERLILVKALINECIKDWGTNAPVDLVTIVNKVFEVDKKGRLNIKGLLSLKKLRVSHPKWKRAMVVLDDAKTVAASKVYTRFSVRPPRGQYKGIVLSFSDIDADEITEDSQ